MEPTVSFYYNERKRNNFTLKNTIVSQSQCQRLDKRGRKETPVQSYTLMMIVQKFFVKVKFLTTTKC